MFFSLEKLGVRTLLIFAVIGAASALGVVAGRYARRSPDTYREPIGVLQGALLGVVGLILAFGLSLAVGRYQDRRADVVVDANTIGTAYLRAQTIAEPQQGRSSTFCAANELAIAYVRGTGERGDPPHSRRAESDPAGLWRLAGEALDRKPVDSAPRLYADSLNDMIDQQTGRLAGLNNRVPDAVLWLELLGAAFACSASWGFISRCSGGGVVSGVRGCGPRQPSSCSSPSTSTGRREGLIEVPATPLLAERATMELLAAARAPR